MGRKYGVLSEEIILPKPLGPDLRTRETRESAHRGQNRGRVCAAGLWTCRQPGNQHANPLKVGNRYGTILPSRRSGLQYSGARMLYSPTRPKKSAWHNWRPTACTSLFEPGRRTIAQVWCSSRFFFRKCPNFMEDELACVPDFAIESRQNC